MLGPILLTILAVALLGSAVWLWPRRAPDPRPIRPTAPRPEPKTEYLSHGDMFKPPTKPIAPPSPPTEFLTPPEPESFPATEYLSREDILGPTAPPDDSLPTTMFSRDSIAAKTKNVQ